MIRRSLLMEAGGFDPKLRRVEDVDLAIRLALMGAYFVGSSEPLVKRYMTDSGYKSPTDNLVAEQQLAMKYKEFLLKEGLYYHAHKWPELRFLHFTRNYLGFFLTLMGLFLDNPIRTTQHLFATGSKRFIHEAKIKAKHIQKEKFLLK